MKINIKYFAFAMAGAAMLFTSCVGDLDTLPLNPSDTTSESTYGKDEGAYISGLVKLYFNFANTSDLQVEDGGASELVRAFWSLQEITADAAKCAWSNDSWVRALNTNTWSDAENAATYGVYARTLHGISFVNEFLRQTTSSKLSSRGVSSELSAKIDVMRAEARFLRAYFYWIALDTFGAVPFTTEESPFGGGFIPSQSPRAEVFDYCVKELTELVSANSDMPAPRSNYPRADKGSAQGLLARMYLNAEVYSGTPMWAEAKAACEALFGMGYSLCSEYSSLFRGDNGENPDARKELIFAVAYNAEKTQSYGGTSYMIFPAITAAESGTGINGINNGWAGNRVPFEYVNKYFGVQGGNYTTGEYTVPSGDKRGQLFYIKGREESIQTREQLYTFLNGWSCLKYNNIPHDKTAAEYLETARTKSYSDIDFPLIRLGEIYLIYAEACFKLGEAATAMPKIQELSARAGVTAPSTITEDWLIAERARELMWEGHRRTDLIRYGKFTTGDFLWTFKGDLSTGQGFASHMVLFALPPSEIIANPNLVQNPGYGR